MEQLLPLISFAFVSSITPGPNNLMLSASGVAFGLKRTLPHMFGVAFGFAALLVLCGAGIGALVVRFPAAGVALQAGGSLYLLYLAWTMRNAFAPQTKAASSRPLTFVEGALFQLANPKAWVMAVTAVSVFVPPLEPRWLAVALVCAVFSIVNLPCICTWAVLGVSVRRWLRSDGARRAATVALWGLMLYSIAAMWL